MLEKITIDSNRAKRLNRAERLIHALVLAVERRLSQVVLHEFPALAEQRRSKVDDATVLVVVVVVSESPLGDHVDEAVLPLAHYRPTLPPVAGVCIVLDGTVGVQTGYRMRANIPRRLSRSRHRRCRSRRSETRPCTTSLGLTVFHFFGVVPFFEVVNGAFALCVLRVLQHVSWWFVVVPLVARGVVLGEGCQLF